MRWPKVALGEVVRWRNDFILIDDTETYRRPRVQLHAQGIVLRDQLPGALIKTKRQQVCKADDLLVAEIDAKMGGYGIVPPDLEGAVVSSHYFLFEIDRRAVLPRYLDFFLRTPSFASQVNARGSTNYSAIRASHVLAYTIPLPPLAEQERIVRRLDAVEAKLRDIQRIRQKTHAEVQVLIARALAAIVGCHASRGTRPLGELVEVVGGGTPTRNMPAFWDGAIPWVTPKDMKALIISDAQQRITAEGLNASPAKLLPQNAVLVVVRGMILARFVPIALLSVPATINQDMKALIAQPPLSAEFLLAWLIANERALFERVGKSTHDTRKLDSESLLSLPVPTLSSAEQAKFVESFQALRARTSALEQRMAAVAAEAEQILPALLAEAFGP